jgi:hypothetical protein
MMHTHTHRDRTSKIKNRRFEPTRIDVQKQSADQEVRTFRKTYLNLSLEMDT